MNVTAYSLAERFTGLKEVNGGIDNPQIIAMLRLDENWPKDDEVPWCSAFVNYIAWLLRLPRSKSLAARSWLAVGTPVTIAEATSGFDVVIFKREGGDGPEVIKAPGHVAFFCNRETREVDTPSNQRFVWVLGGNQSNSVGLARYPESLILGIRRLS